MLPNQLLELDLHFLADSLRYIGVERNIAFDKS